MKKTTIDIPDEDLAKIDELWRLHGFRSRSQFLCHAALTYGENGGAEEVLRLLAEAVFTLHQIRRSRDGVLHLLKKKEMKDITALLSRIDVAMSAVIEQSRCAAT